MGFISRILGRETRDAPAQDVKASDPYFAEFLGLRGARSSFGGPDAAVASLAVAARCVSLISEGLAALPLPIYRKIEGGGREEAPNHPLYRILNDAANENMSSFEFRVLMLADLAQHGNAFARIERDGRGAVSNLYYLPQRAVGVEQLANGRLRYRFTDRGRGTIILIADEVLHLRYRSRDGVLGISPLVWAQDAVGLAMAQAELAEAQARRGFVPDVAFGADGTFGTQDESDAAFRRLKDQISARMKKLGNSGDPLLLEGGLKPYPLATTGREAQFHEARLLSLEDIARIYGVPLSVVGLGKNASYGSLTEESRALVQNCLSTWAAYGERQLALSLLSAEGRKSFEIEHDLDGLLRGDLEGRFKSYEMAIRSGIWNPDECRIFEGQAKRPGGDEYLKPVGMQPASAGTK